MRTLTPGAWYLLFMCKGCSTRQVLFQDLTQGKSKLLASFTVVCPDCGLKATYDGDKIERYHHPVDARRAVA
jgi:ribosomal protein S27E